MHKLILVATLILASLACSFNWNSPARQPKNPTEYARVVYAYIFNANGGADYSFFVEKTDKESSITFEGGHSPTIEDLNQRITDRPLVNLKITMSDELGNNEVSNTTDTNGRTSFSTTFLDTKASVDGNWYCIPVAEWQAWDDDATVIGGGGLWRCMK